MFQIMCNLIEGILVGNVTECFQCCADHFGIGMLTLHQFNNRSCFMLRIKFVDFFNFALITHSSPLFRASGSFLRRFVPIDKY